MMHDEPTSADIAKVERFLRKRGARGASPKEICNALRCSWRIAARIVIHFWKTGKARQAWIESKDTKGRPTGQLEMRCYLIKGLLLCSMLVPLNAMEIPDWVIRGIAMVETRSEWRDLGSVTYVDKRDGKDGEVGFMQLSPIALKQLNKLHLQARCRHDVVLCESLAREYLVWLYRRAGSWERAVAMYNVGPSGPIDIVGEAYCDAVKKAGQ